MATKLRLSTSEEFEIAIRWETLRSEYFRAIGNIQKSNESLLIIKELRLRLRSEGIDTHPDEVTEAHEPNGANGSFTAKPSEAVFA
ncbi:hypothetical protein [Synechococcus sp. UW179A]|uniref:hypothetical protein n=1 Tax=Synechococcus sp. UW179A TaxID=2575510 RepID=UPI0010BF2AAE|nr:hypothetical protein [Synechococcus sp. UW179A]